MGTANEVRPVNNVKVHPVPSFEMIVPKAARAAAASRQGNILADALAVAGRVGLTSTSEVPQALNTPVIEAPIENWRTRGIEKCVCPSKAHSYPMVVTAVAPM
jgi:hypothetical protein